MAMYVDLERKLEHGERIPSFVAKVEVKLGAAGGQDEGRTDLAPGDHLHTPISPIIQMMTAGLSDRENNMTRSFVQQPRLIPIVTSESFEYSIPRRLSTWYVFIKPPELRQPDFVETQLHADI